MPGATRRKSKASSETGVSALLEMKGLTVRYGGVVAVDSIDLAVDEGIVFGLIGPNGAGKTSMVDALTGYTKPAAGTIVFGGQDITRLRPYKRARCGLARTFQSVELFDDLTVDENLLVASEHVSVATALRDLVLPHRPPNRTGVDWAISVCGLEDVADRYPAEISLGQRKLVGVGRRARAADRVSSCSTSPPPASTPTRASNSAASCGRCPTSTASPSS